MVFCTGQLLQAVFQCFHISSHRSVAAKHRIGISDGNAVFNGRHRIADKVAAFIADFHQHFAVVYVPLRVKLRIRSYRRRLRRLVFELRPTPVRVNSGLRGRFRVERGGNGRGLGSSFLDAVSGNAPLIVPSAGYDFRCHRAVGKRNDPCVGRVMFMGFYQNVGNDAAIFAAASPCKPFRPGFAGWPNPAWKPQRVLVEPCGGVFSLRFLAAWR